MIKEQEKTSRARQTFDCVAMQVNTTYTLLPICVWDYYFLYVCLVNGMTQNSVSSNIWLHFKYEITHPM